MLRKKLELTARCAGKRSATLFINVFVGLSIVKRQTLTFTVSFLTGEKCKV